jgi:CDP-diacylglycerol--glycerol-3-phosphate 3-phosphatidyltransferase
VAPGIVVILLARELLVTTFRGMSESSGKNFGAALSGKLKMVFQSVTILVILVYVNYYRALLDRGYLDWATYFRDFCIWATVAITVYSGLLYAHRAIAMYRELRTGEGTPPQHRTGAAA